MIKRVLDIFHKKDIEKNDDKLTDISHKEDIEKNDDNISDVQQDELQRLEAIKSIYKEPRMQYLALHNKDQLADRIYFLRIYCVFKDEHITVKVRGRESAEDIISYLNGAGYFSPSIGLHLPYFSNWPAVEGQIERDTLDQRYCAVCELDDIELELRSQRADIPKDPYVCLYGCPKASVLDDVNLRRTVEVIDYGKIQ